MMNTIIADDSSLARIIFDEDDLLTKIVEFAYGGKDCVVFLWGKNAIKMSDEIPLELRREFVRCIPKEFLSVATPNPEKIVGPSDGRLIIFKREFLGGSPEQDEIAQIEEWIRRAQVATINLLKKEKQAV